MNDSIKSKKTLLSVSRVNLFEQCKQRYYYRYILKLPDRSTYHSAVGNFIHKVLELFVIDYLKTNNLRESASKAYSIARNHKEIVKFGELITPEVCEEVKRWTTNYVKYLEQKPNEIPDFMCAESRFRFQIENTNFAVRGFIDRIDHVGDSALHIIDYKTTANPDYLTSFQLATYSIPVKKTFPEKNILASYELTRLDFKQKKYEISDEDREVAIDKFITIGTDIEHFLSQNDPKIWKPSPSRLCDYCPYKVRCAQDNRSNWI